jgi:hypothetical protein
MYAYTDSRVTRNFGPNENLTERTTTMKWFTMIVSLGVAAGLLLTTRTRPAFAFSGQSGDIQITKECSQYTGAAGSFCTITSSNLAQIPAGTKVYYDQAFGVSAGMLDSNVVLRVGQANWAVGRCTLDGNTGDGICTFSDGVGPLTGFAGRVVVSYTGGPNYAWKGSYHFNQQAGQQ